MKKDNWSSHIGVILAVSGSAVGLGNFLKFPGQIATYGGAGFMIAYVISFFLIAMPLSLSEWAMGRQGGILGYNSTVGIVYALTKNRFLKYLGTLGIVLTTIIFCYYVYIEAWCLGYAVNFILGELNFTNLEEASGFFAEFTGINRNGSAFSFDYLKLAPYFIIVFILNFIIIYKGISKGIEFFCKYAMPLLLIMGIFLIVRIMTLDNVDSSKPEQSVYQGLGFMWNPDLVELQEFKDGKWVNEQRLVGDIAIAKGQEKVTEDPSNFRIETKTLMDQLLDSKIWIAAASQVFYSLTVGFGAIMIYASYIKETDDVVLSSVASASTNEFCEVCLGGMITIPAAVAFFGVAGTMGAGLSLFDLGFKILPVFFSSIYAGELFGFMFFGLLFLGAVTSSLSMLQPSISFLEEAVNLKRKSSVTLMLCIIAPVSLFVIYFSKDLKALDTMDFWAGQMLVYVFSIILSIIFAWKIGAKKIVDLANKNSLMQIPRFMVYILKYFTPTCLITIFLYWIFAEVLTGQSSYINDVFTKDRNEVAVYCVIIICIVTLIYNILLFFSKRYKEEE